MKGRNGFLSEKINEAYFVSAHLVQDFLTSLFFSNHWSSIFLKRKDMLKKG